MLAGAVIGLIFWATLFIEDLLQWNNANVRSYLLKEVDWIIITAACFASVGALLGFLIAMILQ